MYQSRGLCQPRKHDLVTLDSASTPLLIPGVNGCSTSTNCACVDRDLETLDRE
jgi:hypothetical protein